MKRLVGIDLNGWNDFTARNWLDVPGQEIEKTNQVIHGGIGGSVVRVREKTDGVEYIGGIQAERAPHGRGAGWGKMIGEASRRRQVLDLLEKPKEHTEEIARAIQAMADGRKSTMVMAIPDLPSLDEGRQEALLSAMQILRPGRRLLVWRPVLAALAALSLFKEEPWETIRSVGVLDHNTDGFALQTLRLRHQGVPAPERQSVGEPIASELGLGAIQRQALSALLECCEDQTHIAHVISSPLSWRMALGLDTGPLPLRRWNGSWEVIKPPESFLPNSGELPITMGASIEKCDVILLATPTNGSIRQRIREAIETSLGRSIVMLEPNSIACGALEAARRLADGLPVYYDFLPQISTIIQDSDGAKSYNLIPPNALLPAGQLYRSSDPARLGMLAGTEEVKVHLKKESIAEPRRAVVALPLPVATNCTVELHVQQAPAAGRAHLTLTSEVLTGPVIVDWDQAEPLAMNWEELIESLEPEKPTVPNRLVLPCGTENWYGRKNRPGLLELLEQEVPALYPNWQLLARKMSNRPFGKYSVSSDGELSSDLPEEAEDILNQASALAEADVAKRLAGGGSQDNNSLGFLTWLFRRCPDWIPPVLLEALHAGHKNHAFFEKYQSATLLLQGLGRTAKDPEVQRQTFDYLLALPVQGWKKDQMACASQLLSRTESAPKLLKREEVEKIAGIAEGKVLEAVGERFTSRYSYGPFLLVGLLRWRLVDPWALVVDRDPVADRLFKATQLLVDHLSRQLEEEHYLARYHAVLLQVLEELAGEGSNPNLLFDLESMTKPPSANS
ncbi:hypothetical protein R3X27_04900 [Tropicimonas sp. TH_r6]|uniref:hypothetical protein n=1 Tax=Tropicimonas sp. TH_r6 TaxID=3082085 RepID=UPI0029543816|nr:hypothetical protein [Tropicimonas sp. TH_r6]MDV7142016.1 hypothetical protein [Tropicimonas sp. TH_r6]